MSDSSRIPSQLADDLIYHAAARAFDPPESGRPPPALIIESENPASGAFIARRALSRLAAGRGVRLVENTAVSPLEPGEADAMEVFCSSTLEPGAESMRQHIKERLIAAERSSGFFLMFHDPERASERGRALMRELISEGRFDGLSARSPLFIIGASRERLELPEAHDALVARLDEGEGEALA
jgi:hypothetical protein